jgi:dihydrofolate reductase
MKAILSADLNWGIGCGGKLLQRVPEDMKFFMKMTTGKVVVMGRETFESLPGMQPLKDRVNIVLSKNGRFENESLIVSRSLEELFQELEKYPSGDVFVIGGESVYTQLLPYCSEVYVTRFEKVFEADRHFPNLDVMGNWELVSESAASNYKDMNFRFLKYANIRNNM